jgi:hypothetical protein
MANHYHKHERQRALSDSDRAQWVDNDEGLYNWWRSERCSKKEFIMRNRARLTDYINRVLDRDPAS